MPTVQPPPECIDQACRLAASSIQSRMDWNVEPCKEFRGFSCSHDSDSSLRILRSAQETVDIQMQGELKFFIKLELSYYSTVVCL